MAFAKAIRASLSKGLAIEPEDDVILFEDAIGRRTLGDPGDEDLPAGGRFAAVGVDPAPGAGRAEVPVVRRASGRVVLPW